jgi:hypothetical protein
LKYCPGVAMHAFYYALVLKRAVSTSRILHIYKLINNELNFHNL